MASILSRPQCVLSSVCASNQPVFELRMMANKWHIHNLEWKISSEYVIS